MSIDSSNYTVDDSSPFLSYSPYADGSDSISSWQSWHSESGFNTQVGGRGRGLSYHLTSGAGASILLRFHGTGVSLHGTSNATCDITLDSKVFTLIPTANTDVLYNTTNLAEGAHTITLTSRAESNQQVAFDRAVVLLSTNFPGVTIDHSNDTALAYAGGPWKISAIGGQTTYHTSVVDRASVSYKFNGTAISLRGFSGAGASQYSVTLDGATTTHNASASWDSPDALFFRADGLSAQAEHSIALQKLGGQDSLLAFRSLTYFAAPSVERPPPVTPPPSTSGSKTGLIAGVIGGVVGLLALAALAFVFWKRGQRPKPPATFHTKERPAPVPQQDLSPIINSLYPDGIHILPTTRVQESMRSSPLSSPPVFVPPPASFYNAPSRQHRPSPSASSSQLVAMGPSLADTYAPSTVTSGSNGTSAYGSEIHLLHGRTPSRSSRASLGGSVTRERAEMHLPQGHGPRRMPSSRTNQSSRSSIWKPSLEEEESIFSREPGPSGRSPLPPVPHQYPPSPSSTYSMMSPTYTARHLRTLSPLTSEAHYFTSPQTSQHQLDRRIDENQHFRMSQDTSYYDMPPPSYQAST